MAEKGEKKSSEKKEKSSGKKGVKSIVMVILIPIMIVVLIASSFFAIIDGIIKIIEGVVNAIIEFFKNPGEKIEMFLGWMDNVWNDLWDTGEFNPKEFEKYRKNPFIVIDTDQFTQMKEQLEDAVDLESTGLDDITMKKMLLCYYRTQYLKDTQVLIELTKEECTNIEIDYDKWIVAQNSSGVLRK